MPVQGVRASRLLYPLSGSVVVIVAGDAAHRSLGEPILAVIDILIRSMVIGIGRAGVVGAYNVSGRVIAPVGHLVAAIHAVDAHARSLRIARLIADYFRLLQQVPPRVIEVTRPPGGRVGRPRLRQPVQRVIGKALRARAVFVVNQPAYVAIVAAAGGKIVA